jgi:hypothetical protein
MSSKSIGTGLHNETLKGATLDVFREISPTGKARVSYIMKLILNLLILLPLLSVTSMAHAKSVIFNCQSTVTKEVKELELHYESLFSGEYIVFADMKYDLGGADIIVDDGLPSGNYIETRAIGSGVGVILFGSQRGLILSKSLLTSGTTEGVVAMVEFKSSSWNFYKDEFYNCIK